jgi:hypothetical protein
MLIEEKFSAFMVRWLVTYYYKSFRGVGLGIKLNWLHEF